MLVFYGFLWFSIDVLSWKHMETAGRFASKPGCHSTFVRCMPSTRQGRKAFVVHGGCPGFCVSDLSYLEGKQSCACWPTFDMSTMPPSDPPFMSVSFCSLPKSV